MPGAGGTPNLGWLKTLSDDIAAVQADIGTIASLATADKTDVVTAVNELSYRNPQISVLEHGAAGDYVYPSTGTDNSTPFTNAFAAASALAGPGGFGDVTRVMVLIPPGEYKFNTPIVVPYNVDLDMRGAKLHYRGTDYTQPSITLGTLNEYANFATYLGLHLKASAVMPATFSEAEKETWVGIRLRNVTNSHIEFNDVSGAPIAVRLLPDPDMHIAYNNFYGLRSYLFKVGLDIRGNTDSLNGGWVNENDFFGSSFAPSSGAYPFGSLYGVRFSAEPGGYPRQNNNRFWGTSFQMAPALSTYDLSIGKTVLLNVRYINRANNSVYQCTTLGTGIVATVPTHTSGSSAPDANGVVWLYSEPFSHSGICHLNGGNTNSFFNSRWEGGDGPHVVSDGNAFNNFYGVYGVDHLFSGTKFMPSVNPSQFSLAENRGMKFPGEVVTTSDSPSPVFTVDEIHKRAVGSATGLCVQGMHWYTASAGTFAQYANATFKLCESSLRKIGTTALLSVMVDMDHYASIRMLRYHRDGIQYGRLRVSPLDAKGVKVAIANTTDMQCCSSGVSFTDSWDSWATGSDVTDDFSFSIDPHNSTAQIGNIGLGDNSWDATSLIIRAFSQGQNQLHPFIVRTKYEASSARGQRFSHGTPTVGFFEAAGEIIGNINTATEEPVGWVIKTPGILAPVWTATEAGIVQYELRSYGANVYSAQSSGTSGATGPTGTGTVSDGAINWRYIAPVATFEANTVASDLGTLASLETTDKTSIVAAVNEINLALTEGGQTYILEATGVGATDNANFAAALTALTASAGTRGTIFILGDLVLTGAHSMYNISLDAPITCNSSITLNAGCQLNWSGSTYYSDADLFDFTAGYRATFSSTTDIVTDPSATRGSRIYALNTAGDTGAVFDLDPINSAVRIMEIFRVTPDNASGSGPYTRVIEGCTIADHGTGCKIRGVSSRSDMTVRNLRIFMNGDPGGGTEQAFMYFLYTSGVIIENCHFFMALEGGIDGSGVKFLWGLEPKILNCTLRSVYDASPAESETRYSFLFGACRDPLVDGLVSTATWSAIDTVYGNTVIGLKVVNSTFKSVPYYDVTPGPYNESISCAMHSNCYGAQFLNNRFENSGVSFIGQNGLCSGNVFEGYDLSANQTAGSYAHIMVLGNGNTVSNNVFRNHAYGIRCNHGDGHVFRDNHFLACGKGIYLEAVYDQVGTLIQGNKFDSCTTPIHLSNGSGGGDVQDALIINNVIPKTAANTYSIQEGKTTDPINTKIVDNHLYGYGSAATGIDSDTTYANNYTDP